LIKLEKLKNKKEKTEKDHAMLQKMENEFEFAKQVRYFVDGVDLGIQYA